MALHPALLSLFSWSDGNCSHPKGSVRLSEGCSRAGVAKKAGARVQATQTGKQFFGPDNPGHWLGGSDDLHEVFHGLGVAVAGSKHQGSEAVFVGACQREDVMARACCASYEEWMGRRTKCREREERSCREHSAERGPGWNRDITGNPKP
jgi:hypothetical protein